MSSVRSRIDGTSDRGLQGHPCTRLSGWPVLQRGRATLVRLCWRFSGYDVKVELCEVGNWVREGLLVFIIKGAQNLQNRKVFQGCNYALFLSKSLADLRSWIQVDLI